MKKIKKHYYDLIISIGQNCVTPEILNENSLRKFSSPLDWLQMCNYHSVIKLIQNRFLDIFNKEDLKYSNFDPNSNTDAYYNTRTNIYHIHDFPNEDADKFDALYAMNLLKYQRRSKRLLKKIKYCHKICLVYIEYEPLSAGNGKVTNEVITQDIRNLNKEYGKNCFDIFYIKHNPNLQSDEYLMDGRICEINNSINASDKNSYRGNKSLASSIIRQRIQFSFYGKLKIFLNKIIRLLIFLRITR